MLAIGRELGIVVQRVLAYSHRHPGIKARTPTTSRSTGGGPQVRSGFVFLVPLASSSLPHFRFYSKKIKKNEISSLAHDNLCGNDHHAATPTRNPDCRALPTQIVAL
jgi:hypothetical protein